MASGSAPVATRGDCSKVSGRGDGGAQRRPRPGHRFPTSAARWLTHCLPRHPAAYYAATSNTGVLHPEFRPPSPMWVPIAWVVPRDPDWWDTHSENMRETPRQKVSHLISNALMYGRSA